MLMNPRAFRKPGIALLPSQPVFPMRVLPGGVQNCIDDDCIANHSENDPVGKAAGVRPAHLPAMLANPVEKWIARQACHFFARCPQEVTAQSSLLFFVPAFRFQQIGVHLWADQYLVRFRSNRPVRRYRVPDDLDALPIALCQTTGFAYRRVPEGRHRVICGGGGPATRDLESVLGENGFALIFVKSCHGWVLFPLS